MKLERERGIDLPPLLSEPKWVTSYADQVIRKFGDEKVINISTGISLSGPVHVGHLREFMTGALIHNSLQAKGIRTNLLAFADDMDPLKRRYDFLPETYQRYVGVPLYLIPSNYVEGMSYSDYFLNQFLDSMNQLGINPVVRKSSDIYNSGTFNQTVLRFMKDRDKLLSILKTVSGTKKENIWPYRFVCPECHSSTRTNIVQYDTLCGDAEVSCANCNHNSATNITSNGGKLMWRFDWPARWNLYNIHAEPVAQDHASKGGSYDSSEVILQEYFHKKSPVPLGYSWVKSRRSLDLHTKTGVTSVKQLVEVYPKPIVWSMYALPEPRNPILFDLTDSLGYEIRNYYKNLDILRGILPNDMELSPVFKTTDFNTIVNYIKTGRPFGNISAQDFDTIKRWLESTGQMEKIELSDAEKQLLGHIQTALNQTVEWTPLQIKEAIKKFSINQNVPVKDIAVILYKALFSTETGPNITQYFAELPKGEVINKLSLNQ